MKSLFKSVWWRVLFVHVLAIGLWSEGVNATGLCVLLCLACSLVGFFVGKLFKHEEPSSKKLSFAKKEDTMPVKPILSFRG